MTNMNPTYYKIHSRLPDGGIVRVAQNPYSYNSEVENMISEGITNNWQRFESEHATTLIYQDFEDESELIEAGGSGVGLAALHS